MVNPARGPGTALGGAVVTLALRHPELPGTGIVAAAALAAAWPGGLGEPLAYWRAGDCRQDIAW